MVETALLLGARWERMELSRSVAMLDDFSIRRCTLWDL
jgi:hypothetical protein